MPIRFFFSLLLVAVAVVFALQNSGVSTVQFFAWQYEGSLSLILVATYLLGVLSGMFVWASVHLRRRFARRTSMGSDGDEVDVSHGGSSSSGGDGGGD